MAEKCEHDWTKRDFRWGSLALGNAAKELQSMYVNSLLVYGFVWQRRDSELELPKQTPRDKSNQHRSVCNHKCTAISWSPLSRPIPLKAAAAAMTVKYPFGMIVLLCLMVNIRVTATTNSSECLVASCSQYAHTQNSSFECFPGDTRTWRQPPLPSQQNYPSPILPLWASRLLCLSQAVLDQ